MTAISLPAGSAPARRQIVNVRQQALLVARTLVDRADLIVQFLMFFRLRDGDDDDATMQ